MRTLISLTAFGLGATVATLGALAQTRPESRSAAVRPPVAFGFPEEPEDVNPQNPEEALPSFDEFLWKSFLAVNRGVAMRDDGTPGDPGGLCQCGADERPLWMAWIARDVMMRFHPTWKEGVSRLGESIPAEGGRHRRWAKSALDNLAKPGRFTSSALMDINNAGDLPDTFVGPLVDQNRHFVRYEIRFNRIAYDYAIRNKYYDRQYQPSPGQMPVGFPAGSMIAKAAWRVIPKDAAGEAFKKTCFWVPARLNVNGEPKDEDVGLVGLHLVIRTPKRPQWVWSSFEHVGNVPSGDKPEPGKSYSFNYGATPTLPLPKFANADPDPRWKDKRTPQALAENAASGEGAKLIPVQVVREKAIHQGTRQRNKKWQSAPGVAGTVWANYELVVTQFPTRPTDDTADPPGAPFPSGTGEIQHVSSGPGGEERRTPMSVNVANMTMETYFQSVSCMDCHGKAGRYGIDYVYSFGRTFPPEPDRDRQMAAQRALSMPRWEVSRNEPPAVQQTVRDYQARDEVSDLDRRVLSSAFGPLAAPPEPDRPRTRPGRPIRKAAGAMDHGAMKTEIDADFREVHDMFANLMRAWSNQKGGNCPPEIAKRHGEAFGWRDGPWHSWKELEEARFAPGKPASEGLQLIDPKAAAVSEMLLIRVLRGEQVEAAKNKRMPLNGPYFDDKFIDRLVELISQRYHVPAKPPGK
jgi:hypothetical protein